MTHRCPYSALLKAGCTLDHHESDLYVLATPEAERIIRESGWNCVSRFTSPRDGKIWIECAFAYLPFWENVDKRAENLRKAREQEND